MPMRINYEPARWRVQVLLPAPHKRHQKGCFLCGMRKPHEPPSRTLAFSIRRRTQVCKRSTSCLRHWRVQVLLPAPLLIELLSTGQKFYFLAFSGANQRKISQNTNKSGSGLYLSLHHFLSQPRNTSKHPEKSVYFLPITRKHKWAKSIRAIITISEDNEKSNKNP